jgi:hypothetical protein
MGDYVNVVLENSALEIAHMFMHQFTEVFDSAYVRESCVDHHVIEPKTFFINNIVTNSRVANRFQKLKMPLTPSIKQS